MPTVVSPSSEAADVEQVATETSAHPPEGDGNSVLSSDEEMDIDPLFLSDNDSESEATPSTQRSHAPLFLSIEFNLRDKLTGEVLRVSRDMKAKSHDIKNYVQEAMPLCMSEYRHTHTPWSRQ